ncbi:MAG: hypothetical protein QXL99_04760 [Thermoplasmatales archaeon]
MARQSEIKIVTERMSELINLAIEDEKAGNNDRASRKYELIFLYSTKYKVPLIPQAKVWICRKCKRGIYELGGHIRLSKSYLKVSCGYCGYVRRFPISHRWSRP